MMAGLRKRSLRLAGHATSMALEAQFWTALELMAAARHQSLAALMFELDEARGHGSLASAARVAALEWAMRAKDRVDLD